MCILLENHKSLSIVSKKLKIIQSNNMIVDYGRCTDIYAMSNPIPWNILCLKWQYNARKTHLTVLPTLSVSEWLKQANKHTKTLSLEAIACSECDKLFQVTPLVCLLCVNKTRHVMDEYSDSNSSRDVCYVAFHLFIYSFNFTVDLLT